MQEGAQKVDPFGLPGTRVLCRNECVPLALVLPSVILLIAKLIITGEAFGSIQGRIWMCEKRNNTTALQ